MHEYDRAKAKHSEHTLDGALATDLTRLAALVEEVGESAEAMTYDAGERAMALKKELIQVANVALTWASIL
jgi:NTP pyrophosphatase (non-canonical NTP hydrolase)